jgi:hypothetical protein
MVEPVRALVAKEAPSFREVLEVPPTVAVALAVPEALALVAKVAVARFLAEAAEAADTSAVEVAVQTPTPAAPMLEAEAEAPPLLIRPWSQMSFTPKASGQALAR